MLLKMNYSASSKVTEIMETKSLEPMWDLYLQQNEDEIMNKDILDQRHDLIDEKILKYLYDI